MIVSMDTQPILPPPISQGMSLREWLAGCALSNPSLVSDGELAIVAKKAVQIADEVMLALKAAPPPSRTEPLSPETMKQWEEKIAEAKRSFEQSGKQTLPAIPSRKHSSGQHEPVNPALQHRNAIQPPGHKSSGTLHKLPSLPTVVSSDSAKEARRAFAAATDDLQRATTSRPAPPEKTTYTFIHDDIIRRNK